MIRIIEPNEDKANKWRTVYLTTDIPFRTEYFGKRSDQEHISLVRNELQITTQIIFDHIDTLTSLEDGYVQNYRIADFKDILQVLCKIGKSLIEAEDEDYLKIDEARSSRKDEPKTTTENIPDLSAHPVECQSLDKLAVQISEVLKNPDLPVELYNAIMHGTDEIVNTSDLDVSARFETSPEHIKAVLKMRSEASGEK